MTAARPQPRSGSYRFERRTCESCGVGFRAWFHHGQALAACVACCAACEGGDCASCGPTEAD